MGMGRVLAHNAKVSGGGLFRRPLDRLVMPYYFDFLNKFSFSN